MKTKKFQIFKKILTITKKNWNVLGLTTAFLEKISTEKPIWLDYVE